MRSHNDNNEVDNSESEKKRVIAESRLGELNSCRVNPAERVITHYQGKQRQLICLMKGFVVRKR